MSTWHEKKSPFELFPRKKNLHPYLFIFSSAIFSLMAMLLSRPDSEKKQNHTLHPRKNNYDDHK
jgi:hypothetical protein